MSKTRLLSGVSAFALFAGVSFGAAASSAPNVLIDLDAPGTPITITGVAVTAATDNENNGSVIGASVLTSIVSFPAVGSNDISGSGNTVLVDDNFLISTAIGNEQVAEASTSLSTGGPSALNGVLASVTGFNINGTEINAVVTGAEVRVDVDNAGPSDSLSLSRNEISASMTGNSGIASVGLDIPDPVPVVVDGEIGSGFDSTEQGQIQFGIASGEDLDAEIEASASYLASTAQVNDGLVNTLAQVDGARIGLLADDLDIVDTPIVIDSNSLSAELTGNDSQNFVVVTDGGDTELLGSAGIANFQLNQNAADPYDAIVSNSIIQAGDNGVDGLLLPPDDVDNLPIDDLDGSSLTFTNNSMTASAQGNAAANLVQLNNVSQDGPNPVNTQTNEVDFGLPNTTDLEGDLIIGNVQINSVDVQGAVGEPEGFTPLFMSVDVEGLNESDVTVDNNIFAGSAGGNQVTNAIEVMGATTLSSTAAVNTLQYLTSQARADSQGSLIVDVAGEDDSVVNSGVSVDGNEITARAIGNDQTTALSFAATTITGPGTDDAGIVIRRDTLEGDVTADFSVLNVQVVDTIGGDVETATDGSIVVGLTNLEGAAGSSFTGSSLSVDQNLIEAVTIGNLSREASIALDATNISASVGVANVQTVEDDAELDSEVDDNGENSLIEVFVEAETVSNADITVDGNRINSATTVNLAENNSISITGQNVSDGGQGEVGPVIDRDSTDPYGIFVTSGFTVVNDQTVEDLEADAVEVLLESGFDGDAFVLSVGDGGFIDGTVSDSVSNSSFSVSGNSITATGRLNEATSSIDVDAGTLDAASALVNSQHVLDDDDNGDSVALGVDLGDGFIDGDEDGADIELQISALLTDITNVDAQANDNLLRSEGTVNLATNSVDVAANTQILVDTNDGTVPIDVFAGELFTAALGETVLLNEQYFEALDGGGIFVGIQDADIDLDVDTGVGVGIVGSAFTVQNNTALSLARGNDATNSVTIAVNSFDLSLAEDGTDPSNGLVGGILSNQNGADNENVTEFEAFVDEVDFDIDVQDVDGLIETTSLTNTGNTLNALSRVNNAVNTLDVSGTSFEAVDADALPFAEAIRATALGGDLEVNDFAFVAVSRQINAFDSFANVMNSDITIDADDNTTDGDDNAGLLNSSAVLDNNDILAEARGNQSLNNVSIDFDTNNDASTFVGNFQQASDVDDGSALIEAELEGSDILIEYDGGVPTIDGSSLSASENRAIALAVSNQTGQVLTVTGTNIGGTSDGQGLIVDPDASPQIALSADFVILNIQGPEFDGVGPGDDFYEVAIEVEFTDIEVEVDTFNSGSLNVDNNLIAGQGIVQSATNVLLLDAGANVADGAQGDFASAIVLSRQTIGVSDDGPAVDVFIDDTDIGSVGTITRMDSADSAAVSVDNNIVLGSGIGGTATNQLIVTAGANIEGDPASDPTGALVPVFLSDEAMQLDADLMVANVQVGAPGVDLDVVDVDLGVIVDDTGVNNDTITVDNNLILGEATGFVSRNQLAISAGANVDTTGQVANVQVIGGTGVLSDVVDTDIEINLGDDAINSGSASSALSVQNNQVEATSVATVALNTLGVEAGATVQEESGVTATLDLAATTPLLVTGAEYSVLNQQTTFDTGVLSLVNAADILITDTGIDAFSDSTLNVDGNRVTASSIGNDAINVLTVTAGIDSQRPSVAVASQQSLDDVQVSADVVGVSIGITGINGASNTSSSVSNNSVGATAIGNRSFNSIGSN
ncbi:MAG: beta strand repeat-containing protein [Alphaproteobacteria bacterium]